MTSSLDAGLVEWQNWRIRRQTAVTSEQGNLALVQTIWHSGDDHPSLEGLLVGQPSTVKATEIERKDFSGQVLATGVRLWDSNSEAIQAFDSIDAYPYDPNWVIVGNYTAHGEAKPIPFEYIRDNGGTRDLAVPGEISVEIAGENYLLHAFDDDGPLLLVFGDLTNGKETYGSGRFLFVEREEGSNRVILDFNKAFVPPCGFSIHYNCPLPPQQNRIRTAIQAGEKNPLFKNNYTSH